MFIISKPKLENIISRLEASLTTFWKQTSQSDLLLVELFDIIFTCCHMH